MVLEAWKIGATIAVVFLLLETVVIIIYVFKCHNKNRYRLCHIPSNKCTYFHNHVKLLSYCLLSYDFVMNEKIIEFPVVVFSDSLNNTSVTQCGVSRLL